MRLTRLLILGAALALFSLYGLLSREVPALRDFEFLIRDFQTHVKAEFAPDHDVVIIDIDEHSLKVLGPWPWSRLQIAELVEQLIEAYQVRIVGLDVVLPEPRDLKGDDRLAQFGSQRKLVFSEVLDYVPRADASRTGVLSRGTLIADDQSRPVAYGFVGNHAQLAQMPCVGNIGFVPDADGKLRSIPLRSNFNGREYNTLGWAMLDCLGDAPRLPSETTQLSIDYARLDSSWLVLPASAVLRPSPEDQRLLGQIVPGLEGRIALIGSSALGLSDRVSTPLTPSISGVFVHAHTLSQLMSGQDFSPSSLWARTTYVVAGLLGLIALSLALMSRATSSFSAALWGATWIILSGICIQFADPQALLPHTAILAASITLLLAQGSFEWARERSLARSSVRLLERYVSGAVLKTLLKARNFDALKPRHTRITVLVVDLAGYSARVSEYSLEESTAFTRRLLEIITGPVLSHGGTLDRYTGDGLVAFWGAPLAVPQAADRALQAALEIERLVHAELKASIRCGLATGEALVGDVGSAHRAHYTAVGGCINLAARLEALAKELGEQFLLDGATACELRSHKPEFLGAREIRGVGEVELFAVTPQPAPEPTPTA